MSLIGLLIEQAIDDKIARRINKGAKLLDRKYSGWWKPGRFDLDTFSILSETTCVAAQAVRMPYFLAVSRLFCNEFSLTLSPEAHTWSIDHGFDVDRVRYSAVELECAWRRLILTRRSEQLS